MMDYRQSGVNIEEGYRAVDRYKKYAEQTRIPGMLGGLGSFAGMFAVPSGLREPVLVSGTDGVGTKLDIAFAMKKYDTVGIDCVAMCVNDILCTGARPLFFLDYIACGRLDAAAAGELVKGVAAGCVESGCCLLGGETAEMPGFYDAGKYDIAGFAVGIAERSEIISGAAIREGDVLIGLSSSGVHSNGFSLVRRLVTDFTEPFGKKTIGEVLLEPTRIYVQPVRALLAAYPGAVHGMAHITGGGFYENIPRMYAAVNEARRSSGLSPLVSHIVKDSWDVPAVFGELVRRGADAQGLYHTFNMGIGFVLAVSADMAERVLETLSADSGAAGCVGMKAYRIGAVSAADDEAASQEAQVLFV